MSENKCCGNCKHFENEDVDGWGICIGFLEEFGVHCSHVGCLSHKTTEKFVNGWTEITPDNVHEVYEKRGNIAFMNPTLCDYATIWHNVERKILELYVRKGGYYYYVLPELKIE